MLASFLVVEQRPGRRRRRFYSSLYCWCFYLVVSFLSLIFVSFVFTTPTNEAKEFCKLKGWKINENCYL